MVMCKNGFDFVFNPPWLYYCSSGQWNFYALPGQSYSRQLPWPDCSSKPILLLLLTVSKGILKRKITFTVNLLTLYTLNCWIGTAKLPSVRYSKFYYCSARRWRSFFFRFKLHSRFPQFKKTINQILHLA